MAGVKGRSGRKAHLDDKTVEEIVNLSSKVIRQALNDESLDIEFRAELAAKVFVKAMPQKVDADLNHNLQSMPQITKNGSPLEARIG